MQVLPSRITLSVVILAAAVWTACSRGHDSCAPRSEPVARHRTLLRSVQAQSTPPQPTIARFASCQELQDAMHASWQDSSQWSYDEGIGSSPVPMDDGDCHASPAARADTVDAPVATQSEAAAPAASGAGHDDGNIPTKADDGAVQADGSPSATNVQERGVDESDIVKVGAHHVYVQRGSEIQVLTRAPLALVGTLSLSEMRRPELYVDGDLLMAVDAEGRVRTFRAGADGLPKMVGEVVVSGQLIDSRYANGKMVLVVAEQLPFDPYAAGQPMQLDEDGLSVGGVPCDRIVRPAIADGDLRLLKVAVIDPATPAAPPAVTAVLGGGDHVYMTPTSLYIGKRVYTWTDDVAERLVITRFALAGEAGAAGESGAAPAALAAAEPVASGVIDGYAKDQWAFKELPAQPEPVLAVATTTGHVYAGGYGTPAQNHLWILQRDGEALANVAGVHDFGTGEDIRSVRYVGPVAYVVTFKKTDPLFAFDLSEPLAPKLLGELKVPGFSVYMHPVADGRLVGVGFDADDQGEFAWYQGLQVSLFDVSSPLAPQRLDNVVVGQRGSYSDVTSDHHAFYFDAGRHLVGIPAVELVGKEAAGGPELAGELAFSGAILYRVDDTKLVETARVTHRDLVPEECADYLSRGHWWQDATPSLDINRLVAVDDQLLSVSRFGVKAHPLDGASTATTISFPPLADCQVDAPYQL
jgi:hypothetical protein